MTSLKEGVTKSNPVPTLINRTRDQCLLFNRKWFSFSLFSRRRRLRSIQWSLKIIQEIICCFFLLSFLKHWFCKMVHSLSLFHNNCSQCWLVLNASSGVLCIGRILLFTSSLVHFDSSALTFQNAFQWFFMVWDQMVQHIARLNLYCLWIVTKSEVIHLNIPKHTHNSVKMCFKWCHACNFHKVQRKKGSCSLWFQCRCYNWTESTISV